jgi:hypothetical protein
MLGTGAGLPVTSDQTGSILLHNAGRFVSSGQVSSGWQSSSSRSKVEPVLAWHRIKTGSAAAPGCWLVTVSSGGEGKYSGEAECRAGHHF